MSKILIDEALVKQALEALKAGAFGKEKERVVGILEKELNTQGCKHCNGSGVGYDGMGSKCICQYEQSAQEPEFFTHSVDAPYDWSEWVCPDPKGYLMKCCDCGLVHEVEFGVVRYKSETEREDCEMVDDPNLQAVFRMRRSAQWSPVDTAHRAGGLPMEQPAPARPWVGLTDEEVKDVAASCMWWVREQDILDDAIEFARAIEAKLKEKNT